MSSMVGASVNRKEDPNFVTGRGTFTDDITLPRTAHLAYVRSTEAHAEITGIDLDDAREMPGVIAVFTADDVDDLPPLPHNPELPMLARPVVAKDRVRFVGEIVAIVAAETKALAVDAAEAILVDYEPLPVISSMEDAMADPAANPIFPDLATNVLPAAPFDPEVEADIDAVLESAPHRVTLQVRNQRCAVVPIEPNVFIADWSTGDDLEIIMPSQSPHHVRNYLSMTLGIPQHSLRVRAPDIGGGFGAKISWYPEHWLLPVLSRKLGRPVKYLETRSDNLVAMTHGRDQVDIGEMGFDDEGNILCVKAEVFQNLGAYSDTSALGLPVLTTWMLSGVYKIPKIAASFNYVFTNQTMISAYRGAGRPEAAYLVERLVEAAAREIDMDVVEFRRRNFIGPDEFPYASQANPEAVFYDAGNYPAAMDLCCELADYEALRAQQARRRDDPNAKLMGIGFSTWLEIAGFGPQGSLEGFGHMGSWESCRVRVQPDGSAVLHIGLTSTGQSHATTMAQIAADALQLDFGNIKVMGGDTATMPQGIGTMGSRAVAVCGGAVHEASTTVKDRAVRIAAHLLEANPADIEVEDDGFRVKGSPDKSVTWAEIGHTSFTADDLGEDMSVGELEELVHYTPPNFSYPSGAYCCVVGVDRDTGAVEVERYIAVDDCGVVINPRIADGQVTGGVSQGIAQALYEEFRYDENGQPLTSTLMDYAAPGPPELPSFVLGHVVTPTPVNPIGAKGLGESGAVGSPPAVVNAALDALAPLGVTHLDMPLTPEKVWRAIREAQA